MTLATLKTKLKIANSSYDVDLESYLDFVMPYLNEVLGIDLSKLGTTQTIIFKKSYLNSKIVPIESWQTITKVERAKKDTTLSWIEIKEYVEFEFDESISTGSLIEIKGEFKDCIARITGTYGFKDTTGIDLPILIDTFIVEGARQYQNYIRSKGQSLDSERSGNLSVSFNTKDVLTGLGTLDPASNLNLFNLIKKYKVTQIYSFL